MKRSKKEKDTDESLEAEFAGILSLYRALKSKQNQEMSLFIAKQALERKKFCEKHGMPFVGVYPYHDIEDYLQKSTELDLVSSPEKYIYFPKTFCEKFSGIDRNVLAEEFHSLARLDEKDVREPGWKNSSIKNC